MSKLNRLVLAKTFLERLEKDSNPKKVTKEIAAFVLENKLGSSLNSILRDMLNLRLDQGIVELNVESAFPLDKANQSSLEKLVKVLFKDKHKVIFYKKINPDLIGGLRITIAASKNLDLSVRSKINQFKYLSNQGKI